MIRLVVVCFFTSLATLDAQIPNVLALAPYGQFIANMDNYVFIVMQRDEPLKAEEIIAEFSRVRYGPVIDTLDVMENGEGFTIRSNQQIGWVKFKVKWQDTVLNALSPPILIRYIPAVAKLSNHRAGEDKSMPAGEMKAQFGLYCAIECCGFDAKCTIESFEMYRISKDNLAERTFNKGPVFQEEAKRILANTQPGDLFLFRKIFYLTPGTPFAQPAEDMTFVIE